MFDNILVGTEIRLNDPTMPLSETIFESWCMRKGYSGIRGCPRSRQGFGENRSILLTNVCSVIGVRRRLADALPFFPSFLKIRSSSGTVCPWIRPLYDSATLLYAGRDTNQTKTSEMNKRRKLLRAHPVNRVTDGTGSGITVRAVCGLERQFSRRNTLGRNYLRGALQPASHITLARLRK